MNRSSNRISKRELRGSNNSNNETQSRELQLRSGPSSSDDASPIRMMLQLLGALAGSPGNNTGKSSEIDLTFLKQGQQQHQGQPQLQLELPGSKTRGAAAAGAGAAQFWQEVGAAGAADVERAEGKEDAEDAGTGSSADDILKEMAKAAGGKKRGGTPSAASTAGTATAGDPNVKKRPAKADPATREGGADEAYRKAYNETYATDASLPQKRRVEHAQRAGQRARASYLLSW